MLRIYGFQYGPVQAGISINGTGEVKLFACTINQSPLSGWRDGRLNEQAEAAQVENFLRHGEPLHVWLNDNITGEDENSPMSDYVTRALTGAITEAIEDAQRRPR